MLKFEYHLTKKYILSTSLSFISLTSLKETFLFSFTYNFVIKCYSIFSKQEMELTMIGLQNAGKTSLANVVAVSLLDRPLLYFFH